MKARSAARLAHDAECRAARREAARTAFPATVDDS